VKPPSINAFSDEVINQAIERFAVDGERIKKLHSFEHFMYEFEKDSKPLILRITHESHCTADHIKGEVEWIRHLASGGVRLPEPRPSRAGEVVEVLDSHDGSCFSAVVFPKITGQHLACPSDYTSEIVRQWGQILGRIHTLSGTFEPSSESRRRQHWFEDDDFNAEKYLPPDQTLVIERCHEMIERAHTLETDTESYGLIHGDMHAYNFLVTDSGITVLDFEGSRYDWFVNDLAIPVFYAVRDPALKRSDDKFACWFMRNLVRGYSRENTLDKEWFAEIPFFHKLREVMLYILLHAEGLDDLDPWSQAYMKGRRESIEQATPVIDIDFAGL